MAVALLFGTGVLLVRLPREILPPVEDGVVVAQLTLPVGSTMDATSRAVARVERAAHALGVRHVHARVGVATDEELLDGADPGSAATARLLLPVPPGMSGATLVTALRQRVGDLVTAGTMTLDPGGHSEFASLFGREARAVRVLVHGPSDAVTRRWADSVCHWLGALPALTEVRLAQDAIQPVVALSLRRERLAMVGIEPPEVANALRGVLEAVPASTMRSTDEQTPIMIRGDTGDRTVTALLRQPVRGMPLAQLVTRALRWEPVVVERVDQQPVQVVEAQVQTGDLAGATRRVVRVLAEHRGVRSFPAGVHWQVTGAEADRLRTSRQLRTVALVAAALVYLVLAAEFGSATIPGVVMLTVPLSIAGALVALWLTGQSLNAVSLIGIVLLIGMVDNEAVVKLDAIQRQQAAGWPLHEAIRRGSRERVRAILLAALTTIAGVLPLLGGTARGAALYRPLAATLIGGIAMAWMVTSYLLPAVYAAVYTATEQRRLRP
jgi:HAE1 family hydrophobic/amphiphilic exporter-1